MNFVGPHCFSYCSWPPIQRKSRLLIGLNCILLCLNNNSQIAKLVLGTRLADAASFCRLSPVYIFFPLATKYFERGWPDTLYLFLEFCRLNYRRIRFLWPQRTPFFAFGVVALFLRSPGL